MTRSTDVFGLLTSGPPQGFTEKAFYWSDMLHYRRTYEFPREMYRLAVVRTGEVALVDLPESLRPIPAGVSRADSLRNRRVIKRVAATAGEAVPSPVEGRGTVVPGHHLVLLGDHPLGSGDSRQYGFVPVGAVVGVVLRVLPGPAVPADD